MTFGSALKRLREAAGLSQMDLASRAGLNLFTVSKIEQGTRDPSWATACALAKALGVSLDAFVKEDEQPPKKGKGGTSD
ncbi:MAG: helix-turn-helix domain-containing protein [Gemmataceae bacterium]|nr:helix-turn-helix domain-containing protein [Gemmataceae bacterium]